MTAQETPRRIDDQTLIRGGKLLSGTSVAVAVLGLATIAVLGQWHLLGNSGAGHLGVWAIGLGSAPGRGTTVSGSVPATAQQPATTGSVSIGPP